MERKGFLLGLPGGLAALLLGLSFEACSHHQKSKSVENLDSRFFQEKELGELASGVKGHLMNVIDWNGDHFPDLFVRDGINPLKHGRKIPKHWLILQKKSDSEPNAEVYSETNLSRGRHAKKRLRSHPVSIWAHFDDDEHLDLLSAHPTGRILNDQIKEETTEIFFGGSALNAFQLVAQKSDLRHTGKWDLATSATALDFNLDGRLDVFVGRQKHHEKSENPVDGWPDSLFQNLGKRTFTEVTKQVGINTQGIVYDEDYHSFAWSVTHCDLNNDKYSEIIIGAYGRLPNQLWQAVPQKDGSVLYKNRSVDSALAFDQRGKSYQEGGNTGGIICADFNNDGFLDLFLPEIRHWWAGESSDQSQLLLNLGKRDVSFKRLSPEESGLSEKHQLKKFWNEGHLGATALDFDNDGDLDLLIANGEYPGTRALIFEQYRPLKFREVALNLGVEHGRSLGAVSVDWDRDGDLDLFLGHGLSNCNQQFKKKEHRELRNAPYDCNRDWRLRYFENKEGSKNHWISIRLEGQRSNRSAIGARVVFSNNKLPQKKITRWVGGGHGIGGYQEDFFIHAGLGQLSEIDVEIFWPHRLSKSQKLRLKANQHYLIKEGQEARVLFR